MPSESIISKTMLGEKKKHILGCLCLLLILSMVLLMVDYFLCKLCISTRINTQSVYSVTNHIESGFKHFVSRPIKHNISTTFDISGLGNLMFQYASLIGIAHSSHMRPVIPMDCKLNGIFQLPVTSWNSTRPGLDWGKVLEPRASAFDKVIAKLYIDDNVEVVGYLQSWKYFENVNDEIRKHFTFNEEIIREAEEFINKTIKEVHENRRTINKRFAMKKHHSQRSKLSVTLHGCKDRDKSHPMRFTIKSIADISVPFTSVCGFRFIRNPLDLEVDIIKNHYNHIDCYRLGKLLDCYPSNKTTEGRTANDMRVMSGPIMIGVHIRRGDMVTNQKHVDYGYTVADQQYLEIAVKYYENIFEQQDLVFIVCSDDIKWAKQHFNFTSHHVVFSENRTDVLDLAILSKCDHTIMTTGTFGWWASWLAGGQVVYYSNYPRKYSRLERSFSKDKTDYFPPEWIGMPTNKEGRL